MKVTYNKETGTLYIRLNPAPRELANETFEKDPFFPLENAAGPAPQKQ